MCCEDPASREAAARGGGLCLVKGDGEYAEWGPERGTAAAADHAGVTFGAGTACLGGDQRVLFGKCRNTVQQTNQFLFFFFFFLDK